MPDVQPSARATRVLDPAPDLESIERAQAVLAGVIHRTPMEHSNLLSSVLGSRVHLKCENLQRTGSYKIRGAYNRLSKLSDSEKARGVVAASAGNHAQGVAFAARLLGISATIFMPVGAAIPKLEATRDYGADVVLTGTVFDETLAAAIEFAESTGAVFIPPFDHIDVITGQGTLGLEILDQLPEVDTIVAPIGGGGLISGVAVAAKREAERRGKTVRVIGVQAENAAAYPRSLSVGEPVAIRQSQTIADGIAVNKPGVLNFEIIRSWVDEVVTVSEDDIARAMLVLLERAKQVAEPAGAVATAAILSGAVHDAGETVAILSGGNIDPMLMQRVISHGLAASDRYLKLRIMLPDVPGQLATIADLLARANANVIEVLHTRHGHEMQFSQIALDVSVETRGTAHRHEVIETLRAAGYDPVVDYE